MSSNCSYELVYKHVTYANKIIYMYRYIFLKVHVLNVFYYLFYMSIMYLLSLKKQSTTYGDDVVKILISYTDIACYCALQVDLKRKFACSCRRRRSATIRRVVRLRSRRRQPAEPQERWVLPWCI